MQWQVASLFATPVFKLQFEQAEKTRVFFEEHILLGTGADDKDVQGVLSHFHSKANVFEKYPDLDWLREHLEGSASLVYGELLNYKKSGPLRITNAWFNLCEPGGTQPMHNHVNCLLCGTLYLQADENTKIMFHHPLKNPSHHAELYDAPDDTKNDHGLKFHLQESQIDVKTGDCLYWPSYLKHGYSDNKTPGRLSLSFNLMPEKLNVDYQLRSGL